MFMMLKLRSALPFLLKVRTLNILYSQRRNRVCIVAWVTGGIGSKFPGFLLLPGRPTCVPILFFLPSLSSVFFFPFVCSPSLSFVLSLPFLLSVLSFLPFLSLHSFSFLFTLLIFLSFPACGLALNFQMNNTFSGHCTATGCYVTNSTTKSMLLSTVIKLPSVI